MICTGVFFLNELSEELISTVDNLIFVPNTWGYIHWILPGLSTLIVIALWPEDDGPNYYTNLIRRMLVYSFLYEVFEFLMSFLNYMWCLYVVCSPFIAKNWFYETVTKKMFDMFQDYLSIAFVVLILYIFKVKTLYKPKGWERGPILFYGSLAIISNLLPMFFYKIGNCSIDNYTRTWGYFFTHGPNSLPYGYWIHIILWQYFSYCIESSTVKLNPSKEYQIKKVFYVYRIGIFLMSLPNIFWVWSIYITTWISSSLGLSYLWLNRSSIKKAMNRKYLNEENADNEI